MSPESHLIFSSPFRLCILVPITISLSLILLTSHLEGLNLSISTDGFDLFLDKFKLPAAIAGLSIPLAAIAAAQHRSMQTQRQILLTNEQIKIQETKNNFDTYINHKKELCAYVKGNNKITKKGRIMEHINEIHKTFFSEAINGNLLTGESFKETINELTTASMSILSELRIRKKEKTTPLLDSETESVISSIHNATSEIIYFDIDIQKQDAPITEKLNSIFEDISNIQRVASFIYPSPDNKELEIFKYTINKIRQILNNTPPY